jgi:hypothetical protein
MKKHLWKWIGSMFMERKDGELAMSLTRVMAIPVYGMLLYKFGMGQPVPLELLSMFGGLLGVKAVNDVFKKKG